MQVASILTVKGADVATITPESTIGDAVTALHHHRIGALVVSPDGRRVVGIVSERDIVRRMATDAGVMSVPVSHVMTANVHTCTPEDEVEQLMVLMTGHRIRHVPVVVDGQLSGIVSIGDVVKHRVTQLENENQVLYEYMTGTR
jgi:CBS domain-containing protein